MQQKIVKSFQQSCRNLPREMVWAHFISLTPPLFIAVIVPSQDNERSFIYALGL